MQRQIYFQSPKVFKKSEIPLKNSIHEKSDEKDSRIVTRIESVCRKLPAKSRKVLQILTKTLKRKADAKIYCPLTYKKS